MKLDIIVNKYLLIWHLLYQSSVSEEVHKLKQQLWRDYKKEYSEIHGDKIDILNDLDNFIPDDDLIYNMVESSLAFKRVKTETNRYRNNLLEIWDLNKRRYLNHLNNILKFDIVGKYLVCVVHPGLDVVETDSRNNIITIGKKIITRDKDNFLTYLVYKIVKNEFNNFKTSHREIVDAVLELAIINELFTRVSKDSKYKIGKKELYEYKCKIYPYWLMYLGVAKEDMEKYMIRDNIFFNKNDYAYESKLKNIDIYSFITFLVKNKRSIFRRKMSTVEDVEVL